MIDTIKAKQNYYELSLIIRKQIQSKTQTVCGTMWFQSTSLGTSDIPYPLPDIDKPQNAIIRKQKKKTKTQTKKKK